MFKKAGAIIPRIWTRLLDAVDQMAYRKVYLYPFGNTPKSDADKHREIWGNTRSK